MISIKKNFNLLSDYNRLLVGGTLLLIITLIFSGIKLLKPADETTSIQSEATKSANFTQTLLSKSDISRLLSWNLFGQSVITVASPKTLSFVITGIIQSSIAKKAGIVVSTKGAEEKVYNPGDRLPNGDIFERIDGQRIIVVHDGRLSAIVFDQKGSSNSITTMASDSESSYSSEDNDDSDTADDSDSDSNQAADNSYNQNTSKFKSNRFREMYKYNKPRR